MRSDQSTPPNKQNATPLRRVLGLPLLILYGVGVTVGAGIFVMIGTVIGLAGPRAPLAFLVAATIAGITAVSYASLSRAFPKAAGASLYVKEAFGTRLGLIVGLAVMVTGVVSSATIMLGFAGYLAEIIAIPQQAAVLVTLLIIGWLVQRGVSESVGTAAVITVIEIGILVVLIVAGIPALTSAQVWEAAFGTSSPLPIAGVMTAAAVAFFAFIGFEDIVNMTEETVDPARVMGPAIFGTLAITTALYLLLAMVAAGAPDARAIGESAAPLSTLWTQLTGQSSTWLSTLALVAVVNGVIVQIIMASRLLYGMSREKMVPEQFSRLGLRRTPYVAIWVVVGVVAVLALVFPIASLARMTTTITLLVFASVNLSLVVLGNQQGSGPLASRRWIGVVGLVLTAGLSAREIMALAGLL